MNVLGIGGLVLLVIGAWSGLLLYACVAKPKGWAGIKQLPRLRQGHVDALIIGTVFVAADSAGVVDLGASIILLITGYYTALSTGALAWWPDFVDRSRPLQIIEWACFAGFALAWTWVAARAIINW
ncbi:hypothetical protein [Nonomuraea guangzhouensis]|uniref:DUF1761 domain-containing protein n=1 Tax=Nonomuraea guangzhouensis TaxID=1291555 RepID=A0ABW4G5T0_9ACTN|nr:hypothetical protein [Nonomuraea guangzhouensis]